MNDGTVKILVEVSDKQVEQFKQSLQSMGAKQISTSGVDNLDNRISQTGDNAVKTGGRIESSFKTAFNGALFAVGQKALQSIGSVLGDVARRADTLNNFPKVLQGMGFSAKEASKSFKILDKGIDGLPTAMDAATRGAQALITAGVDVEGASKGFVALNDAMLASGTSTAAAEQTMTQFSQALSRGKMDATEWNSITSNMPTAMARLSKETGKTKDELRQLYQTDPKKLLDDLIRIDKEGGKGMTSLADQAKSATAGIQTSFQNMRTSIVKTLTNLANEIGLPEFLTNFAQGFKEGMDKMATAIKVVISPVKKLSKAFGGLDINFGNIIGQLAPFIAVIGIAKIAFDRIVKPITGFAQGLAGLGKAAKGLSGAAKPMEEVAMSAGKLNEIKTVGLVKLQKGLTRLATGVGVGVALGGLALTIKEIADLANVLDGISDTGFERLEKIGIAIGVGAAALMGGIALLSLIGPIAAGVAVALGVAFAGFSLVISSLAKLAKAIGSAAKDIGTGGQRLADAFTTMDSIDPSHFQDIVKAMSEVSVAMGAAGWMNMFKGAGDIGKGLKELATAFKTVNDIPNIETSAQQLKKSVDLISDIKFPKVKMFSDVGGALSGIADLAGAFAKMPAEVNTGSIDAVVEAINKLSGIELPRDGGITAWFSGSGASGIKALLDFANGIAKVPTVEAGKLDGVVDAMKKIAEVKVPADGGLNAYFNGSGAEGIQSLLKFANGIASIPTIEPGKIDGVIEAMNKLSEVSIPTDGGLSGLLFGETGPWVESLLTLANGIAAIPVVDPANMANLTTALTNLSNVEFQTSGGLIGFLMGDVTPVITALTGLVGVFASMGEVDPAGIDSLITGIRNLASIEFDSSGGFLGWLKGDSTKTITSLQELVKAFATAGSVDPAAITNLVDGISKLTKIGNDGVPDFTPLKNGIKDLASAINSSLGGLTGFDHLASEATSAANKTSSAADKIKSAADKVKNTSHDWDSLASGIDSAVNKIENSANKLKSKIESTMTDAAEKIRNARAEFESAGSYAGQGISAGLESQRGAIMSTARDIASAAAASARSALDIHSPSKVFREIGEFTGKGLVKGMQAETSAVEKASAQMASASIFDAYTPERALDLGSGLRAARQFVAESKNASIGQQDNSRNMYIESVNWNNPEDIRETMRKMAFEEQINTRGNLA